MTETPEGDPNGRSREHDWPEPADAASREMCFQQGKACVYEPEDEAGVILTEWPNGVVDRKYVRTGDQDPPVAGRPGGDWRAAQANLARTAGSFRRIALWDNSGGTTRRVGHIDATDIPVLAKPTPEWARKLATVIEGTEANAAEARSGS